MSAPLVGVLVVFLSWFVWLAWEIRPHCRATEIAGEEPLGPISASRVEYLKRTYLSSDALDGDDFEAMLDARLNRPIPAPLAFWDDVSDVGMVEASAAVLGQSSAAVLGSADLATYAQQLREATPFVGGRPEPVYVLGSDEPYDHILAYESLPLEEGL